MSYRNPTPILGDVQGDTSNSSVVTISGNGGLVTFNATVQGNVAVPFNFNINSIALSDADYTLSDGDVVFPILEFTGTLTANRKILCPNINGAFFTISNQTTGGFSIVIHRADGGDTGITVTSGNNTQVYYDGINTNSYQATVTTTGGSSVIWAGDLNGSTNSSQFITSISGFAGGGGTVALNISSLAFSQSQATPSITQGSTSTGNGQNFTISAQSSTSLSGNGGSLNLSSGNSSSGSKGVVNLQTGGSTIAIINSSGLVLQGSLQWNTGFAPAVGYENIILNSNANLTLSSSQYCFPLINFTSSLSLTATRNMIFPLKAGAFWTIANNTTGGQSLQFIGSTGTGVVIPNGASTQIWSDGTNIYSYGNLITWAGDLNGSSSTAQYIASISGNDGYGGIIPINASSLAFGSNQSLPSIIQSTISGTGNSAGQSLTIKAQNGQNQTGATNNNNGGNLILDSGSAGTGGSGASGVAGNVVINTDGITQITVSPTLVNIAEPTETTALGVGKNPATDGVSNNGRLVESLNLKTSNYNISASDRIIFVGSLSGSITLTLPSTVGIGQFYTIIDGYGTASTTNTVTISAGSNTINGSSNYILATPYSTVTIRGLTSNSWIIESGSASQVSIYPLTPPPTLSNWTAFNFTQNIGQILPPTFTPVGNALNIYGYAGNGSTNAQGQYISTPGQAYTLTAFFTRIVGINNSSSSAGNAGICVLDTTSSNKFETLRFQDSGTFANGDSFYSISTFSSPTGTVTNNIFANYFGILGAVGLWIRFQDGYGSTTLNGAITSTSATSITVTSATGFPTSGQYRINIDSEHMLVTGGQGTTTWTVVRGMDGTTAATHSNLATVSGMHTWSISSDGFTFVPVSSTVRTSFLTANGGNAIGFFVWPYNADSSITLYSWKVTTP